MDCKADITLHDLENHMQEKHQDIQDGLWVIRNSDSNMDMDIDEMVKRMVIGATVVRGRDWVDGNQDGTPPGTGVILGQIPEHGLVKVQWENGSIFNYRMGQNGKYELKLAPPTFAIKTWQHSNVRFYATLFTGNDFWHIMVSAACGKTAATKFRAEIRLASSQVPECSNVYHRPVEHIDSEIAESSMKKYTACLDIHKEVVDKQTNGKVTSLLVAPEDIPFTCKAYKKVFVTFDKEDIEEKEN